MTRPVRSTQAGFTLVELLVVMAIIALMSVTAGLGIDNIVPKERLNTSVRQLSETLRGLRSDAISRSLTYYIQYDLDNERYRVLSPFALEGGIFREGEDDDDDRLTGGWQDLPDGVELESITISGRTWSNGTEIFARFDGRGTASDHQIVLSQPRYEVFYTIEVLALTGTFKFHKGEYYRDVPDEGDFR